MEIPLPQQIKRLIEGYNRTALPTVNHGGSVTELSSPGHASLFLKIETHPSTLGEEWVDLFYRSYGLQEGVDQENQEV